MTIYLDNAATSHPKPASVYQATLRAMTDIGASPGRASHKLAAEASALVMKARAGVAGILGIREPESVLFTKNATESINIALKGILRPGDSVLISGMEHNAVVRPLSRLRRNGVITRVIPTAAGGMIVLESLRKLLKVSPRLVVLTHASNVNGAMQPIEDAARMCAESGVPLLLDAAQTAGLQPIPVEDWDIGIFACSGHKALLGPAGTGVLHIRPGLEIPPLIEGGTGSRSEDELQPTFLPDRYESGTQNLPGIAGLAAGIEFIMERGLEVILKHELELARHVERELVRMQGVKTFIPDVRGTGVVSFTVDGLNPSAVAHLLDEGFDIAVRAGLHCAPLAHRTLGTFPEGTVRVSPGFSTTEKDVDYFLDALRSMLSGRR